MKEVGRVILFKAWFINKLRKDNRLRPHHYDILEAYMKSMGLSNREMSCKYDYMLKAYFGK